MYICLLTRRNADLIEGYIAKDPKYPNNMSPIIRDLGIYQNGTPISEICEIMGNSDLNKFVWQVAVSNSIQGKTHATKQLITNYILGCGANFYERLENGDLRLVQDMVSYIVSRGGRHECSWCSKICKYLNEYLFNNDKYFIYDGNVKKRLNVYRVYYGLPKISRKNIEHCDVNWYVNFFNSLEELRNQLKDKLTRSEIDHIMWGFHKYSVTLTSI